MIPRQKKKRTYRWVLNVHFIISISFQIDYQQNIDQNRGQENHSKTFTNYKFITASTIQSTTLLNIPSRKQYFCHSYQTSKKKSSLATKKTDPDVTSEEGKGKNKLQDGIS
jgi:outer membrane translocation and assembly module TamA